MEDHYHCFAFFFFVVIWVIAAIPQSPPTFAIFEYRKQLFFKFLWILTSYLVKWGLRGSEVMLFNFYWCSYCNMESSNRPWRLFIENECDAYNVMFKVIHKGNEKWRTGHWVHFMDAGEWIQFMNTTYWS